MTDRTGSTRRAAGAERRPAEPAAGCGSRPGVGTISARGIYGALGDIVRPTPAEAATTTVTRRLQEQYLIEQLEVIVDNGQTVVIPPIFNDVFTATLKPATFGPPPR